MRPRFAFRDQRLLLDRMSATDSELLRRFTGQQAEDAFEELVRRHLDLVYSAALRQVDGDSATAADVAQAVFTDLARKAGDLTSHPSLTGWLYTSTRYLAANARRSEARRRQREQEALAMNTLLPTSEPEPDWDQLRPVLDETLHSLPESDREAVLWRYFERRSHVEIGTRLGISENAARMRVERALGRLRSGLIQHGIESSGAALGLMLTQRAVQAAPVELSAMVCRHAISRAGGLGRGTVPGRRWLVPAMVGLTVLLVSFGLLSTHFSPQNGAAALTSSGNPGRATPAAPESYSSGTPVPDPGAMSSANASEISGAPADSSATNVLTLLVVAADSGKPLPNVSLIGRSVLSDRRTRIEAVTLRDGSCRVFFPAAIDELELMTQTEGFADTRLVWSPQRGERIPSSFSVRLVRPVTLSGRVVDANGLPVAGAKVGLSHEEDPANLQRPLSHEFGEIEVVSDGDGHWKIDRIADDMVRRIHGGARHPDHVDAQAVFLSRDTKAENALRAGTHVFQLGRALTVQGLVEDASGQPVPGAKVAIGLVRNIARREAVSDIRGRFTINGCPSGKTLISAQAAGFAVTTEEIELTPKNTPVRLVLRPGALLRLRLVDRQGNPVPHAHVWLNTWSQNLVAPPQAEVELRSDAEGRVVWEDAPDADLLFNLYAKGCMQVSDYKVHPDGEEHLVTLPPGLTVSGTVRNASTGQPVPKFRIITGWPAPNNGTGVTHADWSTQENFWLNFEGGEFRHTYVEPVNGGKVNLGYVLKFEADDFGSYISRIIAPEEGEVRLDVSLNPAAHRQITVVTPEGRMAAQAELALLGAGGRVTFTGRSIDPSSSGAMIRVFADSHGQITLSTDDTLQRVLILHDTGFADLNPREAVSENTWVLRPWGRISGRWMNGDQPVAGRELMLQGVGGTEDSFQFEFPAFIVKTDGDGRFGYDRVPPGRQKLVRVTREDHANGSTSWRHGKSTEVEVKPGEVTEIFLGTGGNTASMSVVWPTSLERQPDWEIVGAIHTPLPEPPADVAGKPEAVARWQQTPEFRVLTLRSRQFQFTVRGDRVVADEVEPGDYLATVLVLKSLKNGGPPQPILTGRRPVHIPDQPGHVPLDLGEIVLQPAPSAALENGK